MPGVERPVDAYLEIASGPGPCRGSRRGQRRPAP